MSWVDQLAARLTDEEGKKNTLYKDTKGILTIGIGYNIQDRGLPDDIIMTLFGRDVDSAVKEIKQLVPQFDSLSDNRKIVLCDMLFNLGMTKLAGFHNMLMAVNRRDWITAANQMEDSLWAQQVGHRADELVAMMKRG